MNHSPSPIMYSRILKTWTASIGLGIKKTLAYPLSLGNAPLRSLIIVGMMILVWQALFPQKLNYLAYFVAAYFFLFPVWWTQAAEEYTQEVVRGWHLAITKPVSPISYHIASSVGEWLMDIAVELPIGLALVFIFHLPIALNLLPLLWVVLFLWRIAEVYFLMGFSYFFYSIWGFTVSFRLSEIFLSGMFVPLAFISSSLRKALSVLPFYHSGYSMIEMFITGKLNVLSLLILLVWSLVLIVAGYFIHAKGWKRFESQGG